MERMISKLTGVFVLSLLLSASATVGNPQERPRDPVKLSSPETQPRTSREVTSIDNFGKGSTALDQAYGDFSKAGTQATANEIRCRGYSRLGGSQYVFFDVTRDSSSGEIVTYEMAYTPSVRPAGPKGEGLQPGECSWVDRIIGNNGPYRIRFNTSANAQLRQQLHGTPLDTSPTAAERYPDAQSIPEYMKLDSHYWSFVIQNTSQNSGYFEAASNKYWKPTTTNENVILLADDSTRINNDSPYLLGRPIDVNSLAAKGEAIANQDSLAVELRNQQADGPAQRGFDIGMAAAEGQTAAGPGKQKIRDSLTPEERVGFDAAVSFSLERNKNGELAGKGAAIAEQDPVVAEARNLETDVFYRLGFDIATGIFGNPALGAKGNTATGPGSLKIRDSLSAAGQRGFDAAVKLHLSRNYKR
ncbi:MAG TPA: hypothetical protein VGJ55_05880 [Pyrinomonadaceae bacterium]|jgi:hypothetical protein